MNLFKHFAVDYRVISSPDLTELKQQYYDVWKADEIPSRQLQVTKKQGAHLEKTPAIADLIDLIRQTKLSNPSILEIGCSTGYHAQAFVNAKLKVRYEGCDYSRAFIDLAKQLHPDVKFRVDDATRLSYGRDKFDIVVSGCCLLHIIDYQKAIKETARVAKKWAIFHRTPVVHQRPTTYVKKKGYGFDMVEIFFNEAELIKHFVTNKMAVVAVKTHSRFHVPGLDEPVFMKNYLCYCYI